MDWQINIENAAELAAKAYGQEVADAVFKRYDALLQKSFTVDFLTKKKKMNEGEIPQYYVEGNHEAIIDPDAFETVQREMAKRGHGNKYRSGVHLFSGKIKCGECGSYYGSKVWHSNSKYKRTIWQCNHKFDGDKKCATPHFTDEDIKQLFLSAVNKLLSCKDTVIEDAEEMMELLFDTADLEKERDELMQETQVVADLVQQAIRDNAHIALDQTAYQKRYDDLVLRFDTAKARLEEVLDEIQGKKSKRADMDAFIKAYRNAPQELAEFSTDIWLSLLDFATVYSDDDIRFTFKNGQEIQA